MRVCLCLLAQMYFLKIISIIENYGGILILGHAFFYEDTGMSRARHYFFHTKNIACPKYTTVKNKLT